MTRLSQGEFQVAAKVQGLRHHVEGHGQGNEAHGQVGSSPTLSRECQEKHKAHRAAGYDIVECRGQHQQCTINQIARETLASSTRYRKNQTPHHPVFLLARTRASPEIAVPCLAVSRIQVCPRSVW